MMHFCLELPPRVVPMCCVVLCYVLCCVMYCVVFCLCVALCYVLCCVLCVVCLQDSKMHRRPYVHVVLSLACCVRGCERVL